MSGYALEEREDRVVVSPRGAAANAAVVWMHGLGADGHDFVPLVPELRLPQCAAMRFVFPHAPRRPVTLNNGLPMRAWYDIRELSASGRQDAEGTAESARRIAGLLDAEIASGIPATRVFVAGFSQGGAIALHTALRYPARLGGLLALSTYLPLADRLAAELEKANRDLPILMCHGEYDPVLPLELGEGSRDALRALGFNVEWRAYPMQHEVCRAEIDDIGAFLAQRLREST